MTPRIAHIIPTIHPAAILHGGRPISDVIIADLMKANRVSMEGYHHPENLVVCLPSNPSGLAATVRAAVGWMDRWRNLRCRVAVDIETSSLDFLGCRLYSIALAGEDGSDTAVTFSLADFKTLPWDAEYALTQAMRQILADPFVTTVYHNAPYDYAVMSYKGYAINGPIEDTLALHHIVQPDIPHDLGWVGHTYLDTEPWKLNHKGEKLAFETDPVRLLIYNAKDALNTIKLRTQLASDIAERGMSADLIAWQSAFSKLAARMELAGLPVNMQKRAEMGHTMRSRLDELKHQMREWLNWPDFNPQSKDHAVEALYSKKYVGLTPTAWTEKTKQPSTKYENIIDHMEHPFVKRFVEFGENAGAYAMQFRDPEEGPRGRQPGKYWRHIRLHPNGTFRLHPKVNPCGTKGSRFSTEPNVQNQRPKDRAFFEAPAGRVIVGADKDQLELRLAACFAGVRELLVEMAKPDGDPHRLAAINVYGDEFLARAKDEQKRMRDAVKNTVYASLYMAGVKTVHKTIRKKKFLDNAMRAALTIDVVSHIYHSYFGKYVEIPAYHQRNMHLAETQGYNEIPPFGRRRYFPVQPPPMTEVANWSIQCSGSDYVTKEMVLIQDELDRCFPDAWIILHGHDAVYIECYERHALEICHVVNQIFGNTVVEGPAGTVALTAEAKIGKNLLEAK